MRMYVYLDKEIIKCIAAKMEDISFDIDFFEYSEKRGYTTNNNTCIRPELEKDCSCDLKEKRESNRKRLGLSEDMGVLCNVEVIKRYINIEDVSSIKNNNFYYNIVEKIQEDNRIKIITGRINKLDNKSFFIQNNKFIINEECKCRLADLYENACEISCLAYKINCLDSEIDVFKTIAVYID